MSDNLIHISNTPIFDAMMREHNITNSLSPNSSLRKVQDPVLKPVLPVRDRGASLHENAPQKPVMVVAQTEDQDTSEIIVKPLHDSVMFHGISAEEALENASEFSGYVRSEGNPHVFVKKVSGL